MLKFNVPAVAGNEAKYISEVLRDGRFSGNHNFTKRCGLLLQERLGVPYGLITSSGTHALEMAAIISNIGKGDEVIMASYGFSSTANSFVLRGAKVVFVDIRPDTMNIDENLIEQAITEKTRAIVPMHYAGVACCMDKIIQVATKHNLFVIEDAAQAILSTYKGKYCGSFGQFGCFSFHETKNIQCGEGGALIVNDTKLIGRADIIQEKGTDRKKFFRGEIDKYTWIDIGSSYLPSELSSAFLFAQLESADEITNKRLISWQLYYDLLTPLAEEGFVELPFVPTECNHNGHIFFIKTKDIKERDTLIKFLRSREIYSVFHYVPLHSSPAGLKFGRFEGEDKWTTIESGRLLRLPLFYKMAAEDTIMAVKAIYDFFGKKSM